MQLNTYFQSLRVSSLHTDSAAAWAQRTFFGGKIPAGSWFAALQRIAAGTPDLTRVLAGAVTSAASKILGHLLFKL
jgi:hypothetical protein